MRELTERTKEFSEQCNALRFEFDGYVYNPLDYAWENHKAYLEKYILPHPKALLLGMNPGPFGMMQTGVPFGEINTVVNYLKLTNGIGKPEKEHPNRKVEGLCVKRSEISGLRLWSLARDYYPDPVGFASEFAVMNYCPLGFLSSGKTAKNITPDKLLKSERDALYALCNEYLKFIVELLSPDYLIGVGQFARQKLEEVCKGSGRKITSIIHPSPGNPQANRDWQGSTVNKLKEEGIWNSNLIRK